MADLKVRNLDDRVASALKARAKARGISLEEEIRRTLTASVAADREELVRRAKALHAAAGGAPGQAGARQRAHHPRRAGCLGMSPARLERPWSMHHG